MRNAVIPLTMSMRLIRMHSGNFVESGIRRIANGIFGPNVASVRMNNFLSGVRVRVLLIRVLLGLLFAFLLSRFFLPQASIYTKLALAGALVFAAYVLETLRRGKRP